MYVALLDDQMLGGAGDTSSIGSMSANHDAMLLFSPYLRVSV
jgi:hypothetical protein